MSITVKPHLPRHRGNQWYPLPHDYDQLTDKGQREARVSACRQWMLQGPSSIKGEQFAECVRFFDAYYLMPMVDQSGSTLHDPLFYKAPLPTPAFHYTILRSMMAERKTAFVGPRGSAKTIGVFTKAILLTMLASPMYGITYATSTNELAEEMGDRCKYQFYNNERMSDDFGPEYGGQIKPKKSEGKMGMGAFKLSNRSGFFATSAQSVQRGLRPDMYLLDDPEYDAKRSASVDTLAEGTERLIFEIALPMVQQANTHLVWGGTFISLRHYLWRAMQTETVMLDGVRRERPIEAKFGSWRRIIVDVEGMDKGKRTSCWPHQWPVDEAQKKALGLQETTQTLADIEAELGPDRYMTEYRARPGQGKGAYFPALTKDEHYYWPKDGSTDEQLFSRPAKSGAVLRLMRKSGEQWHTIDLPIRDVLTRFPRFIVCDASDTATRASDYKTAMCLTITDANELIVLDVWGGQCEEDDQIDHVFRMADKWIVPSVHVEDIKAGKHLKEAMSYRVSTRAMDVLGITHLPTIAAFNPGMTDKQTKIKTMRWRFMHGKVKFPWHLRDEPAMIMLLHQLANFHPLAANGGLERDDFLDTLSMMQYVVKGLSSHTGVVEEPEKSDVEKLLAGQTQTRGGMPLLATALHKMGAADIDAALEAIHRNGMAGGVRKHMGSVV